MKKIFLLLFFALVPINVFALDSGEQYSESATKKYELGRFYWNSGSFGLYGHNGLGMSNEDPQLQTFKKGYRPLYTYYDFESDSTPRSENYTIAFTWDDVLDPTHYYEVAVRSIAPERELLFYFRSVASMHQAQVLDYDIVCTGYARVDCYIYAMFKPNSYGRAINFNYNGISNGLGLNAVTFHSIFNQIYYPNVRDLGIYDTSILDSSGNIQNNDNKNKGEIIDNQNSNTHDIINNQNNNQQETNKRLDDLNNNLTNDKIDGATGSANEFFNGFNSNDYGLTSIIKAPLNLIASITSSSCSPIGFQAPFVNQLVELPCMRSIYQTYFGSFLTIYQTITFGIVAYWVSVKIFFMVKGFKDPDSDRIEVLDL